MPPVESAWVAAPRDAVLIVDGIFLHRPELRDLWDWSVWLDVPYEVAYARMALRDGCDPDPEAARTPATARGQELYLARRIRGARHPRSSTTPTSPTRTASGGRPLMAAAGVLLVDKPGGMTSHDVVARARRALGTRKIGHAGTLDPMATGLLILGVEGATRLLTFIVGLDKTYEATIRLGVATDTDDAEGVETARADAAALAAATPERIAAGVEALTGRISQVPSTVSAIKVGGRRAYDLAREGVEVELKAREVTVSRFEILAARTGPTRSISTSSSTARAAPTSGRSRAISAADSASAGTSRPCAGRGSARSTSRTRHPPTNSPTRRSPLPPRSRQPCSAAST